MLVCSGSDAEEAVFGVDCPEAAVLADPQPCDVIADAPHLVALLAEELRRNEHCEIGLSAGRREGSSDVLDVSVRILKPEDKHMLCHPALFSAEVGCYPECEALLSEKHVSAVTGVDRPDRVVLREVAYVPVILVDVGAGMESLNKVGAVSEDIKNVLSCSCHDEHIEDNIYRVGKLDSDLCEIGFRYTHRVGNNIHRSALH